MRHDAFGQQAHHDAAREPEIEGVRVLRTGYSSTGPDLVSRSW